MKFFRKAESVAENIYGSVNPNHIRLLVKIRLMISRLYQRKGLYAKSIVLLWKNIDLLKMEAAVRMNEFIKCDSTESLKMIKWSKYFIVTLFQLISGFLMIDEVAQAIESAKMIEWITKAFFDPKKIFYLNIMDYLEYVYSRFDFPLMENLEMCSFMQRIIDKHFHPEQIQ